MKWKPRVIIAGVCLIAAMALTSIGFNSFIEAIGYMAAGFLFGTLPKE